MKITKRSITVLWEIIRAKDTEKILSELGAFVTTLQDKKVHDFFLSPMVPMEQKNAIVQNLDLLPQTVQTLQFVISSKFISNIHDIVLKLSDLHDAAEGILRAQVKTPTKLTAEQKTNLEKKLGELTNSKEVHIEEEINPSLVGGITISARGMVLEGSVASKIEKIRSAV